MPNGAAQTDPQGYPQDYKPIVLRISLSVCILRV
jgi:hypothetical protein